MTISMTALYSLSFSSLKRRTRSVHYESSENWILSIVPGNSSNDLFHDDFDDCGMFCKLKPLRTQTEFCPKLVSKLSFSQNSKGKDLTRCVHKESLQISFFSQRPGKRANTSCFIMISMSVVQFS